MTDNSSPQLPARPGLPGRLLRLALALACLWFVMYVLAPLPVEHFEPMRTFARAARENDITPGSLYYTDVPVSTQAEMSNRDTIRYFYEKKEGQGE